MRNILIECDDIMLCTTELVDLDVIISIERDKKNKHYIYQWSMEQHYRKIIAEDWMHIVIIRKDTQTIIGYILLEGIQSEHDTIELTRMTIQEKGKGYGRKALKLIKSLCFETFGCHRLWLDVFEDNKNAISLYETEDFLYEGTFRECKKHEDKYYSMHIMSILKHEYFKNEVKK